MPDSFTDSMTVLSRQAFDNAGLPNQSARSAAEALAAVPARSFPDILARFAPTEASRENLTDGLCRNDPARNRASMDKKVRNWLSGRFRPTAREDLWELCFILKMETETADGFLAMTSEEGIHWRDPKELCYAFALRKGMDWPEAQGLLRRVLPEGQAPDAAPNRQAFTQAVRGEADRLETETELAQYLRDAQGKLGAYHNRAYLQFTAYLELLEKPRALNTGEEESYTVRRIVETYLDNKLPPGWDKKKLDEKRQGILAGWPDEVTLSRMKTGSTDVNRKTLMLLFLATDGGEELSDDWEEDAYDDEEEEPDADEDFRSSYLRMNQMLSSCGYCMLDSRNPFDWVVLYCMHVSSDPDAMEGLNERLSEMLEVLFPEPALETE